MGIKVRFAPSPTGIPHVGNIRTALFNYFFAKANNGIFVLRIEDTDQARKVEGAIEAIKESLKWLGIDWDEYYVQSAKLSEYKKFAEELVSKGLARNDDGAIRFIVPKDGSTSWEDKVGDKKIEFQNSDVEDFIILKSDGFPTYHFANVIDDHEIGITHVIRGEDWISSTPKHILLYNAFGWEMPYFVHLPNILGTDGKKLSKRRGAKSVLDFKSEGYLPDAILNYLMLLGWSPKDDREILSRDEIVKAFSLEKVNASPAIFDQKKLEWMNSEYIRNLTDDELEKKLSEFDKSLDKTESIGQYVSLAKTRIKTLADFKGLIINSTPSAMTPKQKTMAEKLIEVYKTIEWSPTKISTATIAVRDQLQAKTSDIYTVLTGRPSGLPFEQKIYIEGKETTIDRLRKISS